MSVLETYNEVEVIDSYISEVDNGEKAFAIERPTIPTLLNPEKFRISYLPILIFAALGAMLGAFFVILRQAIMDRNERTKTS